VYFVYGYNNNNNNNDKIRNDCVELVHSMPVHVVALNKVKGSFTKYSTRFSILSSSFNDINVWFITRSYFLFLFQIYFDTKHRCRDNNF